jgi:predicted DNA-binding protein YlxM (UPF0122 family)
MNIYQEQIRDIFGTTDLNQLRQYAAQLKSVPCTQKNPRNAGRKSCLSEDQIVDIVELHNSGFSAAAIADKYEVSRQTIYKYLDKAQHFSDDPNYTLRINYMNRQQLCTTIDVDFRHEKIKIKNHTDKIPLRAFGVVEEPSWKDFEIFLQDRCLPASRAGIKEILRDMGVPFYDPLLIIEKTEGRIAGDHQWMQLIKRPAA